MRRRMRARSGLEGDSQGGVREECWRLCRAPGALSTPRCGLSWVVGYGPAAPVRGSAYCWAVRTGTLGWEVRAPGPAGSGRFGECPSSASRKPTGDSGARRPAAHRWSYRVFGALPGLNRSCREVLIGVARLIWRGADGWHTGLRAVSLGECALMYDPWLGRLPRQKSRADPGEDRTRRCPRARQRTDPPRRR
jgi:hypothetical protein